MNLIFLHVPKCAGTSVTRGLKSVYGEHLFIDRSWRRYRGRNKGWQWHSRLPFDDSVIEFPRPDIGCVTGHFTWVKYTFLAWDKIVFLREPYSRIVSQYSIRGHRKATAFGKFVRTGENAVSRMVGDLRQYSFVGLVEHFDESMDMLERYIGAKMKRVHKNFRRVPVYEPTKRQIRLFHRLNGQDIDLYKKAVEIFERQREVYNAT